MVNVVTGRGGWFHNFGGLSTPINMWTAAYYKPGTFNTGFDVWVNSQNFSCDNRHFEAEFNYCGDNDEYTVIAVMNEEKDNYSVVLDGEKIPFSVRDNSAIEIKISGSKANHKLVIE